VLALYVVHGATSECEVNVVGGGHHLVHGHRVVEVEAGRAGGHVAQPHHLHLLHLQRVELGRGLPHGRAGERGAVGHELRVGLEGGDGGGGLLCD